MAQIANKDLNANARRRLASVAHHLTPLHSTTPNCSSLGFHTTSAPDSYRRVHGEVPTHDVTWNPACDESGKAFTDIIYEKAVGEAIAKITINRPERRNAFRPNTVKELIRAFNDARDDSSVGVIIFTGKGTKAFCSGGDQAFRGRDGYADHDDFGRLNVLDLQMQIRRLPKPVIAMVAGYAVGGGHVLHMVCDLTIAAANAIFGQTGPKVGSFDAGYGSSIMSRLIGPKKAREMWFTARFYTASEAEKMGLVNIVVPLENLEKETVKWCREILRNSPTAIRVLKSALNAVDDGHAGLQELVFGAERGLKWAALGGQIGRDTAGLLRKTRTEEKQMKKSRKIEIKRYGDAADWGRGFSSARHRDQWGGRRRRREELSLGRGMERYFLGYSPRGSGSCW